MLNRKNMPSVHVHDLQKAQKCKNENTQMCNPKACEHCQIQKIFCCDNKARRLCDLTKDDLLNIAYQMQVRKEAENQRLRKIIAKHMRGDLVCQECKHFEQCKIEAEEENDVSAQNDSRFWNCSDLKYFEPNEI